MTAGIMAWCGQAGGKRSIIDCFTQKGIRTLKNNRCTIVGTVTAYNEAGAAWRTRRQQRGARLANAHLTDEPNYFFTSSCRRVTSPFIVATLISGPPPLSVPVTSLPPVTGGIGGMGGIESGFWKPKSDRDIGTHSWSVGDAGVGVEP